jgi:hypothetical protein
MDGKFHPLIEPMYNFVPAVNGSTKGFPHAPMML